MVFFIFRQTKGELVRMIGERKWVIYSGIIVLLIISIRLFFGEQSEDSSKYTVAIVAGTRYEKKARDSKQYKEIKLYPDEAGALRGLANNRVDGAIIDHLTGLSAIRQEKYRSLKLTGDLLEQEEVRVAFRREDKKLRQTINRALTEIINNGTYARISRAYFGCDILQGLKRSETHPDEPAATDGSWNRVRQAGEIYFAVKGANPPFDNNNAQHELTGFDVDIAKAVCQQLNLKCIVIPAAEDVVIEGLRAKYYDGIWGRVEVAGEQLKDVDFSDPYYFSGPQLIVKENFLKIKPGLFEEKLLAPTFLPPIRP
jgi:ABC-type amino acid transport substrate-binding protein